MTTVHSSVREQVLGVARDGLILSLSVSTRPWVNIGI